MNETAVLYTLTTLAQSCAALAAFVGAVGVFRIQLLRDQRHNAERELRTSSENLVGRDVHAVSLSEVLGAINKAGEKHPDRQRAIDARHQWEAFVPLLRRTRCALIGLEVWNLFVIGISLVGFNYVLALTCAPWLPFALWAVVLGTVLIPLGCVIVWTQGVEQ